jgi:hypothetical protein
LINLLADACLMTGFELKRKQVDQLIVNQAAEDVLGLVRPAVVVATQASESAPAEADAKNTAKGKEAGVNQPAGVPAAAVPWSAPAQVPAANNPGIAVAADMANAPQAASAVAVAEPEQKQPAPPPAAAKPARDGGRTTKSTFDVLIAALKQNRAVARD